eukprot:GDKI01035730.1.p1 GENE.GDKI01035730.1~~GDKI01035730.1.p1  ORF type:complete len:122 (-),score=40.82 GDKI01035730.1:26-391(-)
MHVMPGLIKTNIQANLQLHNSNTIYMKPKDQTVYTRLMNAITRRAQTIQTPSATPVHEFAQQLFASVDHTHMPCQFVAGDKSTLTWLLHFVAPKWLNDMIFNGMYGLKGVTVDPKSIKIDA